MSVLRRLGSGSAAAWARIGVTFATQIALVPIFLSHWDQTTYGVWLAIQAAIGLTAIFDVGHQNYVGFEFLRLGPAQRPKVREVFSAALPIGLFLGTLELALVVGVVWAGWDRTVFAFDAASSAAGEVLILQSIVWLFFGSIGGVAVRVVAPFGYYARFGWWGVFSGVVTGVVPAMAVRAGAGLLGAGIALAVSTVACNAPMCFDLWRLLSQEEILPGRPDWALGLRNLGRSLSLTLKTFLEMARQQGTRLVLGPLAGAAEMAAFSTMRTGANVALQGLGTITNPLMPELMRFLNERDQERTEAAFGLVWLVVAALLVPGVVAVQLIAPDLFPLWTRGKIAFDAVLFAMLSIGVLIFALAQPPMAVVQGHNLLRPQLVLSFLAAVVSVGGIVLLVPAMGVRGAALALLAGEVVGLIGYIRVAKFWLQAHAMSWPQAAFRRVLLSVAVASGGLLALAEKPGARWEIAAITLFFAALAGIWYWRSFPQMARDRTALILASRLPFVGRLLGNPSR